MKQAQPTGTTSGGPVLEVQAYAGRFYLVHDWHNLWSTRATKRRWIRFALDVRYSQSPRFGSVKMYTKSGTLRGSANLSVPSGQCEPAGKLYSKPTCLGIVPVAIGSAQAWANSFVTSTSGPYFAPQLGKTIGWAFEDNGPKGGTVIRDRWRVVEHQGSCPSAGDPSPTDMYDLDTGDLTVTP